MTQKKGVISNLDDSRQIVHLIVHIIVPPSKDPIGAPFMPYMSCHAEPWLAQARHKNKLDQILGTCMTRVQLLVYQKILCRPIVP